MSKEMIESLVKSLHGTGGGRAMREVMRAIKILEQERGALDPVNTKTAVFALMEAITPAHRHADVLISLARRFRHTDEWSFYELLCEKRPAIVDR